MYDPNDPARRSMFDPNGPAQEAARQQQERHNAWFAEFQQENLRRHREKRARARADEETAADGRGTAPAARDRERFADDEPPTNEWARVDARPSVAPATPGRRRARSALGLLTAALASLALAAGAYLVLRDTGTAGTVSLGSNVRAGAGTSFAVVADVDRGESVRVECLRNGWARLAAPHEGRYVFAERLDLEETPAAC